MLKRLARLVRGSDEGYIKNLRNGAVAEVNELEPEFEQLRDDQLRAKTEEFRERARSGETLDDLLPEAFAAVRVAAKRTLDQRHFDVQIIGGIVLHQGKIAEMKTGEGKTLSATLPAYLNAITGDGVHVVTVNDYLARRDAQWMGPIYHMLGLSVGALQHDTAYLYDPDAPEEDQGVEKQCPVARREAYRADITYGTNNEFGFDYLRDNMVVELTQRAQRPLAYAIVDEVDNILIDEARTPLIISGPAEASPKEYQRFSRLVPQLRPEEDYTIEEKHRAVSLTGQGTSKLEKLLKVENLYDPANFGLVHFVENALKANSIYQRDREYVVKDGEVIIVDEFTGRLMHGRRYSDGLHQALEAKESVRVQRENITHATITLQNYFRLYSKLAGMTGTAATEAEEFYKIYKLDVVSIPTHEPMIREDLPDLVFKDEKAKFNAVVQDIEERCKKGQPVLVGTTDISKSEHLSELLKRRGVPHEVLNAKQHEREAMIVAQAGAPGSVTVATNMAGRGTDIILGGNADGIGIDRIQWEAEHKKVVELGGLYILGTERHEARRIDNQLRGRSGRQGDPGMSRFYVGLDDELMRRFGENVLMKGAMSLAGIGEDVPLESRALTKSLEMAQVKVEAYHFDIRKQLVDYDDVVNAHRDIIYSERDKILQGADLKANIQSLVDKELRAIVDSYTLETPAENWDVESLISQIETIFPLPAELSDPDEVVELAPEEIVERLVAHGKELYELQEQAVTPDLMRTVERQVMVRIMDGHWVNHLTTMGNLLDGIGLHAYGQRDPLVMFKKEGHELFQDLLARIENDIVHAIYHLNVTQNGQQPRSRTRATRSSESVMSQVVGPRSREPVTAGGHRKVGRNEPCPCGSNKKYKRCHGA